MNTQPIRAVALLPAAGLLLSPRCAEPPRETPNERRRKLVAQLPSWTSADDDSLAGDFQDLPCASIILDRSGDLCRANRAFMELAGLTSLPDIDTSFSIYVAPASLADFLGYLRDCRGSDRSYTASISLRSSSGGNIAVRLFTRVIYKGKYRFYHSLIVDDSKHALARQKAGQELSAYQDFVDSVDGIVWELDVDTGRTNYLSKKAERLLGFPRQEWTRGNDFRAKQLHVDDRERFLDELARAATRRESFVTEYRMITADRKVVWLRDSVVVREVDGRLKLRGVAIDITDVKAAQALVAKATDQLEQRVKERTAQLQWTVSELESFSYTLSHDMRAPLRAISSYAEYLSQTDFAKAQEPAEFLGRIMNGARRLDALITDVLKYSSLAKTPIELKPIDLDTLVRAIAEETAHFSGEKIKIQIVGKLLPIVGHEGFITQCLSNLFSNALKFAGPEVKPRVRVWTEEDDGSVRIWVADNGIGIPVQDHMRIFKVFERCNQSRKIEGTGIGLAIVQRAAEKMNGKVGVESSPGKGSKFWIQLPRPLDGGPVSEKNAIVN